MVNYYGEVYSQLIEEKERELKTCSKTYKKFQSFKKIHKAHIFSLRIPPNFV